MHSIYKICYYLKYISHCLNAGPTKNSVDDFWRMIWEYDVATIFMLTHLVENGKVRLYNLSRIRLIL